MARQGIVQGQVSPQVSFTGGFATGALFVSVIPVIVHPGILDWILE